VEHAFELLVVFIGAAGAVVVVAAGANAGLGATVALGAVVTLKAVMFLSPVGDWVGVAVGAFDGEKVGFIDGTFVGGSLAGTGASVGD
jgi:hypothetical protein